MRLLRGRPPNVEKLKRKGDVGGLVRALSFEDPITDSQGRFADLGAQVRKAATEALVDMDSRPAFEGLLRALDDPEESVRITAVRGLRRRGDPLAVDYLTSAVTNWTQPERSRSREEALEALAFLRDPSAPRRVAAALLTRAAELDDVDDANVLRRLTQAAGHDTVRVTAEDLIGQLREGRAPPRLRSLLVWLSPESVEPLIAALHDPVARREAILALGSTHDSRAVEPLCSILLGDDEPPVRIAAAWALGEIKDPGAVQPLLVATGDGDFGVRSEASQSFDKLGNAAIAVAMGTLVRQALENGAGPSHEAIATGEREEADTDGTAQIPATLTADDSAATKVHERPTELRRPSQVEPVLRRLLGRRWNP